MLGRTAWRAVGVLALATLVTGALVISPATAVKFLTKKKALALFYTKTQADTNFLTQTEGDGRYYTQAQADANFLTQTEGDARYYTQAQADSRFEPVGKPDLKDYCLLPNRVFSGYAPCAWGVSLAVDTSAAVGDYVSAAIGGDGLPVFAYFDDTNDDLKVARCHHVSCTTDVKITTVDGADSVGLYTSIAIGRDSLPVISYHDDTNDALKVVHCGNLACSGGNDITTLDSGGGNFGVSTSIMIGSDGFPIISYYDQAAGDLKVVHCGSLTCMSGNSTNTVESSGDVGVSSSIAVGSDFLPVIAYRQSSTGHLRVAHCTDVECQSGSAISVDTTGNVALGNSLTIGADGLPVIAYSDEDLADLKVAHCGNVTCTSGNQITPVITAGFTGGFPSIDIAFDGNPMISFRELSPLGRVRALHCGTATCSGGTILTDTMDLGTFGATALAMAPDGVPIVGYFDASNNHLKVARPVVL